MIPLKIWTFLSDAEKIPNHVQWCIDSWKLHNPKHEIIVLSRENIATYDIDTKSMRLSALEKHGGVWMDPSVYCGRPLDLPTRTCNFIGYSSDDGKTIESFFMAARKNSTFVKKMLVDGNVSNGSKFKKSRDGPFKYLVDNSWHSERAIHTFASDPLKYADPIIMFRPSETAVLKLLGSRIETLLENRIKYVVISIVDRVESSRDNKRTANLSNTISVLHPEIYRGVNGYDPAKTLRALKKSKLGFFNMSFRTYGTLACFLSKYFVIDEFAKSKEYDFLCVIEDDLKLHRGSKMEISDLAADLRRTRGDKDYLQMCDWGEGYVISKQGAANLLEKFSKRGIFENIDNELARFGNSMKSQLPYTLVVATNEGDILKTPSLDFRVFLLRTQCHYINLNRSKDRRESFLKSFGGSDLSNCGIKRFDAIDGKLLDAAAILTPEALKQLLKSEALGYRTKHYEVTRGSIGCFLSHTSLYEMLMKDDEHDSYIVFEDDVVVSKDIRRKLSRIELPPKWDILLFYTHRSREFVKADSCSKVSRGGLRRLNGFWGMQGYMINKRGARAVIERVASKKMDAQIDSLLSRMTRDDLVIYATPTNLVETSNLHHTTSIQVDISESSDAFVYDGYPV